MARNSYIRKTKLTNVKGRIDYISNPERQEHLYATYSTVPPEYWDYLSEQAQYDFWRSHQPQGECTEALELVIALPESLQQYDKEKLLMLFTEKFRSEYGVQCTSALHHNKAKSNYHIHLIFSDRDLLEKTEVKYATRNMFYNEEGRHVRTKKEILDADGNIRTGCKIVPKGQPYEMSWFSARRDTFKNNNFIKQAKEMYTDLINQCLPEGEDRLQVFDAAGPYLPTKKIGKNNPKEKEIKSDNKLRMEWNNTVDQVLIAGGSMDEVVEFKHAEVMQRVGESIKANGQNPGLFAAILQRAIEILRSFLAVLMKEDKTEIANGKMINNPIPSYPLQANSVPAPMQTKKVRPNSLEQELRMSKIAPVHERLTKSNRKLYALQKQKITLEDALEKMPKSIMNHGDRKALATRIEGLERQISNTQVQMNAIAKMAGYSSIKAVYTEYKAAKAALEDVRRAQAEYDGIPYKSPDKDDHRISLTEHLAMYKAEQAKREAEARKNAKVNDKQKKSNRIDQER